MLQIAIEREDYSEVIMRCDTAILYNPELLELYYYKGIACYQENRMQESIDAYKTGLEKKADGYKDDFINGYGKSFLASAIMGALAWSVYNLLYTFLKVRIVCLAVAIGLAVCVYLILYVVVTGTGEEQMRRFPMGRYMVKILRLIRVYR